MTYLKDFKPSRIYVDIACQHWCLSDLHIQRQFQCWMRFQKNFRDSRWCEYQCNNFSWSFGCQYTRKWNEKSFVYSSRRILEKKSAALACNCKHNSVERYLLFWNQFWKIRLNKCIQFVHKSVILVANYDWNASLYIDSTTLLVFQFVPMLCYILPDTCICLQSKPMTHYTRLVWIKWPDFDSLHANDVGCLHSCSLCIFPKNHLDWMGSMLSVWFQITCK